MASHDFHVRDDAYPKVGTTDELIIVHRDQIVPNAVLYIGSHSEATVEIRSAANRTDVETVAAHATLNIPSGGKARDDLPGSGKTVLDAVTKITVTKGSIFVYIASFGEFDTYFKQVNVTSI